jgi:hypothetical protein
MLEVFVPADSKSGRCLVAGIMSECGILDSCFDF